MKKLCELTESDQQATMILLWKRMRHLIGQTWVREYGDANGEAIKSWNAGMVYFTIEEIRRGVEAARDWTKDFPPTFGQWKSMCKGQNTRGPNFTEDRLEAERDRAAGGNPVAGYLGKLGKQAGLSEVAKTELDKMRRMVAGENAS